MSLKSILTVKQPKMRIRFGFYVIAKDYTDYVVLESENQDEIIQDFKVWLESKGLNPENSNAWIEETFN